MKKSILSTLVLGALGGLSLLPSAASAVETEFEFHGYFRAGFFASAENDFKKAPIAGQKELLGRLGIESDNDGSLDFLTRFIFDEERVLNIHIGIGDTEFDDLIGFVEMQGIVPRGANLWAGKRKLGSENYIFMTDFSYTDLDGLGAGISKLEVGNGFLDFAYISSSRSSAYNNSDYDDFVNNALTNSNQISVGADKQPEYEYQNKPFVDYYNSLSQSDQERLISNQNNTMHTLHAAYNLGRMTVHGNYKFMPNNWDLLGNEWADTGYDVTAIYHMPHFFGAKGNAFSYAILQAGEGLGSGNLLGGTITDYSATRPGSAAQGFKANRWKPEDTRGWGPTAGDPYYLISHRAEDATSARLLLWGGYTLHNGIAFLPSFQAQYNDEGTHPAGVDSDQGYNYWYSGMVRNVFPVNENFFVQSDVGYYKYNWNGTTWDQSKFTVAPTFIMSDGESSAEIRFSVSYLPDSWTNEGATPPGETSPSGASDVIFGIQADAYW
ncbi:carbohydrate porin [Grimontia sp. SpTr1]|uniref:carbohydrate porin n=1 Tax=Grimontia sp. SpTr1 TaxID=2995319 RepID=UPI00248D19E4|nr:carbohydrate porin [Grimontia sp. SpTr1]